MVERWVRDNGVAAILIAAGIAVAGAEVVEGDAAGAIWSAAITGLFATILLVGKRFGALRRLRGEADEREQILDSQAIRFSYGVTVLVAAALGLADLAHGRQASPWLLVDAIMGLSYLLAIGYQALRDR